MTSRDDHRLSFRPGYPPRSTTLGYRLTVLAIKIIVGLVLLGLWVLAVAWLTGGV